MKVPPTSVLAFDAGTLPGLRLRHFYSGEPARVRRRCGPAVPHRAAPAHSCSFAGAVLDTTHHTPLTPRIVRGETALVHVINRG